MIGSVVDGKYEIGQLIGEGGMGAVYEAHSSSTGRDVAIKLISNESVAQDEVRFEREAQAAAKVRSPHIVEILDAGHDAKTGHPYMVMERLIGENMLAVLRRLGPLPIELAVRVGIQTSLGLFKAHSVGVVHRDIKPANLFLSEDGDGLVLKLLDFGVAKFKMDQATDSANESLTRTGSMLGSPMYMSPEQARGLKTIDHRADIWSLGIVLYQLLSGKTPHAGIDGLGELIITICSEEPEPLDERASWVPTKLAEVVHGALKLASDARYQDANEFAKALMSCLADPNDYALRKDMLVALTDEQKAVRAELPAGQAAGSSPAALGSSPAALGSSPAAQAPDSPAAEAPNEATVALDDLALFPSDNKASQATPSEDVATVMLDPEAVAATTSTAAAAAGPVSAWAAESDQAAESKKDDGEDEQAGDGDGGDDADRVQEAPLEKTAPSMRSGELGAKAKKSPAPAAAASSRPILYAMVVGLLVGAVGLYYFLLGPGAQRGPVVPTSTPTTAAPSPTTSAAAAPSGTQGGQPSGTQGAQTDSATSASASTSQSAAATGEAKVKVIPAYATVTVDGKRVTVSDGHISLQGEPNSVHNIVVMVGGKRKVVTVTLTTDGPVPKEIVFLGGSKKQVRDDPYD